MSARLRAVPAAALVALVFVSTVCGDPPTGAGGGSGQRPSLYVGNTEPTAHAGGPYSGGEGVAITLDGSASTDPEVDVPLTYAWDFESDGTVDVTTTSATVQHSYPDDGTFTASLTVTDSAGLASLVPVTATVTVANDPPTVSLPATLSATAGSIFALTGELADKGAGDQPWRAIYVWGDGTADTTFVSSVSAGVAAAHSYSRGGVYTVQVTVTDADGGVGSGNTQVTVVSLPLVVNAGGPYSGTEGGAVSFDAGGSSDPDGDPLTYAWTFGDGGTGTGATPTHTYADNGSYTVTLTASDGNGSSSSATATASIANAPPVVNAGVDASVGAGATFTLAGTFSDAGAVDNPWTYSINWGDGSTNGSGSTTTQGAVGATHVYNTPGSYTVTLTVTDKNGAGVSDALALTVNAVAPVANAGGPYSGTEGAAITFNGGASTDPNGDALTYSWNFGDGTPAGTGATPSHTYRDNGAFTVTLTVNDGNGHTATATATATITNAPPVVNAGPDGSVNALATFTLSGSFTDAGVADNAWNYVVVWGDGTPNTTGSASVAGQVRPTHVYTTPGSYTVTLTVTDKDGAGVSDAMALVVNAVKPVAQAGGPYSGTEGGTIAFNGAASTDPNGDALTYSWNWGDGTAAGTGATPTHVYRDNGAFTVTLTVTDPSGNTGTSTATATIANAPPVVNAGPDAAINEAGTFTLAGSFTDAGVFDNPWAYQIVWGDGSGNTSGSLAAQGPVGAAHTFNAPGSYTVTLTVTDKNGAGVSDALVLTVNAVKPTARPGGPYTGVEGSAVAFNGTTSSDPNGNPLTYSWNWGDGTAAGTGATPTHTYANDGTYTVTLTVNDGTGYTGTATTTATIANVAPVANAGPDATIDEAQPTASFTLNGSFTDVGTLDTPWAWVITWGDGSATTTGSATTQGAISRSHGYAAPGTYNVSLKVTDKQGGTHTDALVLTVRALWPTANIGGPYSGAEGSPIAFNGAASTDPNGDALAYAWDFNADGITDAATAAPAYTYNDGGSYAARLIVTDPAGHADTASAAVTVANVVGTVSAGPDAAIAAGGSFKMAGSFNDSPSDGPWSYQVAWGDGTTTFGAASAPGPITPSHVYATPGSYTAVLTVTGTDGGSGTDAAIVTVGSFANPVANANGPYAGNEGAAILFSSAGSTPPSGQTLTYSWRWSDGTTSTLPNPSKAFADNGTYLAILTVRGSAGGTHADTAVVNVANVAPTATFVAPASLVEGTAYTLSLTGTDASSVDRASLQYAFDCGQGGGWLAFGTAKSVTCPAVPNQQSITAQGQVRDKDGAVKAYTKTFAVANAAPVVAFRATTPTTGLVGGATVSFEGSFTDKGALDSPWNYTVVWGDGTTSGAGTALPGTPITVSHVYTKPGTWSAYMTVKDKDLATGTSPKVAVSLVNDPPIANANGPYAGTEGALIQFSSLGSSDPNGSALTYSWTFGDGTTSTVASPKKAYADNGSYTARLIVKDPSGAADTATATVTTTNVAPTSSLAATAATEGMTYTVSMAGTDLGTADRATLQYALDCGQGAGFSAFSTTKSVTCPAVPDQRALTVRGQVRDKDGAVTSYSKALSITNAAPVVTFTTSNTMPLALGATLNVTGSFTDKGTGDGPWTYTIVWGDGTPSTTGTALPGASIVHAHAYTRVGTFLAYMTVRDKDLTTGTSVKRTITVQ